MFLQQGWPIEATCPMGVGGTGNGEGERVGSSGYLLGTDLEKTGLGMVGHHHPTAFVPCW